MKFLGAYQPLAWAVVLMASVGCGGGSGPTRAPVAGKVTRLGQPLKGVRVEFYPNKGGGLSTARTDDTGGFSLDYVEGGKGAVVGMHRVKICLETLPEITPDGRKLPIASPPEEFPWPETITVQQGSNSFEFNL